ncbi:MAG: MATE family efflux transporter [Acidimicrobiia bacterium]|nr:MATE family efflux transporter [Acidimicrobiia bacterium]
MGADDREILRLAVPAFGALVAEPLYVLADTAVVGHLGTDQLAGLGVASSVLLTAYFLFVFLAYGTTGAVARLLGADDHHEAARQGLQGMWLALVLSIFVGVGLALTAPAVVGLLGADGAVRTNALVYLRISLLGTPALFVTMAGTGYLRGLQDTRTPLVVAVATSVANLAIQLFLIYALGFGIGASAASTVIAQTAGAAVYVLHVIRSARSLGVPLGPDPASIRHLGRVGWDLFVRTAALRGSLLVATAVVTRMGRIEVAAHQIAFEIWSFLALSLDAIAIAGQAITGRALGAGDVDGAHRAGRRMLQWGLGAGLLGALLVVALRPWLGELFSDDQAVVSLAGFLFWWVAALQPVNGVVFVLDGLLMGAGDVRFLARAMVAAFGVFVIAAIAVLVTGAGIGWLWAALAVLMTARLIPLRRRFDQGAWAVTGASR